MIQVSRSTRLDLSKRLDAAPDVIARDETILVCPGESGLEYGQYAVRRGLSRPAVVLGDGLALILGLAGSGP